MGYKGQISNRLERFLNDPKNLEFYENGDPENGPSLDASYVGPYWSVRLADISEYGPELFMMIESMEIEDIPMEMHLEG